MHSNLPGSDLTKEPFRWDQRLFGLVLRMGGCRGGPKGVNPMLITEPTLGAMCDVTGGNNNVEIIIVCKGSTLAPNVTVY